MIARLARLGARALFGRRAESWLGPAAERAGKGVALVLGASLLSASLGLATPWLTAQVIDRGILGRDADALVFWACASFAAGLAATGLGVANAMLHLKYSSAMLADLRGLALSRALRRDPRAPQPPVGELVARIDGDAGEIQRFTFDSALVAVGAVFRLIGGLALMLALDWRLALIPLAAAPLELFFLSRVRPRTNALAERSRSMRGALAAHLTETAASLPTLRALGAEPCREQEFMTAQAAQIEARRRQRLWAESVGAATQILAALTRGAVLLLGGMMAVRGEWGVGALVAFLAYMGMTAGPLRNLLGLYHAQAQAKVALDRLAMVMEAARDPAEGAPAPRAPSLEFRAARAPHGRHAPVSARILPGDAVLLDGPAGVGKSQLLGLLTRLADPAEGAVLIGGVPVDALSPETLVARIAHLHQRPALTRGTVAEALRLAAPDASDAALIEALAIADLPDLATPEGLARPLEEMGASLSGGQRQKLALARALLRDADVYLFDESFSEIDEASVRRILPRLDAHLAGRTRIFVAHAGAVRAEQFDQRIALSPAFLSARGEQPAARENARVKAV